LFGQETLIKTLLQHENHRFIKHRTGCNAEMRKVAVALIMAFLITTAVGTQPITPLLAKAQPQPPSVATLGPPVICSAGDAGTNVKIFSPQNQIYSNNPIQLVFSVTAIGMLGQFGNVGYSLDGGVIKSVTSFINKSVEFAGPDWWNRTTVFASFILQTLSEGVHNATVYYGWQYLGANNPDLERYEVFAYATVDFAVGRPTITPPTISIFSPENNLTTKDNSMPLVLNLSAPVAIHAVQSELRYAYYEADWLGEKQYLYIQNASIDEHFQSVQLNVTLSNIPIGTHKLLIVVGGSVTIRQAMFVEEFESKSNSTIMFNVKSSVQSTNNLTIDQAQIVSILLLTSAVAIEAGLLFYFKKRKNGLGRKHG
jgi:hypothetical protein